MAKEHKDKHFIKKPIYEGGPSAMKRFIAGHLKYPAVALEQRKEGTVVIRYGINHQGKVMETKVISGVGLGCDEEAVRLVRLLRFTVPKNRGVRVLFHKTMKIHFRLKEEKAPAPAKMEISYHVKSTPKKDQPDQEKGGGYSYTIYL